MDTAELAKLVASKVHISRAGKSFRAELEVLSKTPLIYENADLLDHAMTVVPLDRFYEGAEKDFKEDPSFGEQDYVIKEMLKYVLEN